MHERHDGRTRRTRAPRIALGAVALGVALAARAFAQLPPAERDLQKIVALSWSAPPECPDASYVMSELGRQLSSATIAPEKRIVARAEVTRGEGKSWHLRLVTESAGQRGDRALDAESCRAAADATALIVAMAVDPSLALAPAHADAGAAIVPLVAPIASGTAAPPATASAAPTATEVPAATATPAAAPTPRPPPRATPRATAASSATPADASGRGKVIALSFGLAADDGALSGVKPGLWGAIAWIPKRARVELGVEYFPATRVQVASNPARGADLDLAIGALHGCYVAAREGKVELGPCAGAEVGWMRGAGFGVASASAGGTMWAGLLVGGLLNVRVSELFSLRLSLDAVAPLSRPSFVLDSPGVGGVPLKVHKSAGIVGRGLFGAELRF